MLSRVAQVDKDSIALTFVEGKTKGINTNELRTYSNVQKLNLVAHSLLILAVILVQI